MPQHLTGVRAVKTICGARVEGDAQGSMELVFEPGEVKPGDYLFDIGTAGSTSLLLQTVLPPLVCAKGNSGITLKGGTHVPFSPPFHYVREVFVPVLHVLGVSIHATIENYGFYPKGGGKISVKISPQTNIRTIHIRERGNIKSITGISGAGNLPLSIAHRQRDAAKNVLLTQGLEADIESVSVPAVGQGTFIFLKVETENCIAGFSALGERGKRAETVGEEAARLLLDYYHSTQCLDPNLADQIVLYLALAAGESFFTTSRISNHLITNLDAIEKFLDLEHRIKGMKGSPGTIILRA
jgi:RNA 3'-terminal phosphate cyclase (ATP)